MTRCFCVFCPLIFFSLSLSPLSLAIFIHDTSLPPYSSLSPYSSNILLDRHLTPKLSDFGLARECLNRPTHVTTVSANSRVAMGTVAYMAPEFLRNSKPSSKTDVYAFGVVMLELFTGQAADDPSRDIRTLVSIINNDYTGFQCIVDPYTCACTSSFPIYFILLLLRKKLQICKYIVCSVYM